MRTRQPPATSHHPSFSVLAAPSVVTPFVSFVVNFMPHPAIRLQHRSND
jgi:hypothetical protein